MNTHTYLFILILAIFSTPLFAQPTPPSLVEVSISNTNGDGCGNSTSCDDGLICFDVYLEIDEPGWDLVSYNIWMDYSADTSFLTYHSDKSCNHEDGGDVNVDQAGRYRFLSANFKLEMQPNIPELFHNFCLSIKEATNLTCTNIIPGGTHFNLVSSIHLADQMNIQNAINPQVPFGEPAQNQVCAGVSEEIIFNDCNSANIFIDESQFNEPTFNWSTGDTTAAISDLIFGNYQVTITENDTNCPIIYGYDIEFPAVCLSNVEGAMFIQDTNICNTEAFRIPYANQKIEILPQGIIIATDEFGQFEYGLPPGDYTLNPLPIKARIGICPDEINIQIMAPDSLLDSLYFDMLDTVRCALPVSAWTSGARPGRFVNIAIGVKNNSFYEITNATVQLQLDSFYNIDSIIEVSLIDSITTETNSLWWNIDTLRAGQGQSFRVWVKLDTTLVDGDQLYSTLTVDHTCGQLKEIRQVVRTGYDPNDKALLTTSTRDSDNIMRSDSVLDYRIRFQNTGNDTTFRVVILDTISELLDVRTFEPGPASHDYTWRITEGRAVEFVFDPIVLPQQSVDDDGSQGFVTYSIARIPSLELGDSILNKASIYFDFNSPILTNTVNSEYIRPVLIDSMSASICFGDSLQHNGVIYFSSTTVADTFSLFDEDSISLFTLEVFDEIRTIIDTLVLPGTNIAGNSIFSDTTFSIIDNSIVFNCDSIIQYNVEVISGTAQTFEPNIQISPNPFTSELVLHANQDIQSIQLYNANGQLVHLQTKIHLDRVSVKTDDLESGLYVVRAMIGERPFYYKVMKL